MAKKQKFLLVSLQEDEAKQLGQVINNDTSRKILDYLADKEATESELAKKLNIAISTIHYNLQILVKTKLVEAEEYHYSKKGKEILHYKLANKYIIIAPKSTHGIKVKLRGILPVALIISGAAFIMKYLQQPIAAMQTLKTEASEAAVPMFTKAVPEVAMAADSVQRTGIIETGLMNSNITWFVIGAISSLALYFLIQYIINWRNKK